MTSHDIVPDRVTKPIQLLAAWLVGLILVNASFLFAAQQILHPSWGSALLLIAAVVNVPVFIGALFLLQTKFRPQMQEDSYYSKYLEFEKNTQPVTSQEGFVKREMESAVEKIISSLGVSRTDYEKKISDILKSSQLDILVAKHGSRRSLAELFVSPQTWKNMVVRWGDSPSFTSTTDALIEDGLVEHGSDGYESARLTKLGLEVARLAEQRSVLYSQKNMEKWERSHKSLNDPGNDGA
jgi:hypothetical protein